MPDQKLSELSAGAAPSDADLLYSVQGGSSRSITALQLKTYAGVGTDFDAKGDILAGTADDAFVRLPVGADDEILVADTAESTGLNYKEWADIAPVGAVLQTLSTTKSDTFSVAPTASLSWTDVTGFNVAITPASSSNKVLVIVDVAMSTSDINRTAMFRLVRDSTAIAIGDAAGSRSRTTAGMTSIETTDAMFKLTGNHLDSPATASAVTYKVQVRGSRAAVPTTVYVNRTGFDGNSEEGYRTVSSITVMEIKG